jgi:predicted permease
LLLLWCAVVVVLLIGCINVAGLLIARAAGRKHEIGTRMALGGGRAQVIHQLVIESLLLAFCAGATGLAIGWAAISAIRVIARQGLGLWQTIDLDGRVLLVSAAVMLVTALLFGIWPAVQASRVDIRTALTDAGGRSVAGTRTLWPRRFLIVGEVALGVLLLIASGLVIRSFLYLRNQPLGFDPHNVVAATLPLQDVRYQTTEKVTRLFDETLSRIRSTPGVAVAAVGMSLPYERGLNTMAQIPGQRAQDTVLTYVTPDYFRTLGISVLRGRTFTPHDNAHAPRVGIVNASFAQTYFGSVDAVGRSINQNGGLVRIIGLVPNVPMRGSLEGYAPLTAIPVIFVPAAQVSSDLYKLLNTWFTPSFIVRSSAQPSQIIAEMRQAAVSVDPLLPFSDFHGIIDIRSQALVKQRFQAIAMFIMAGLALLLASVGIYGLISYTVVERRRELGIRMALGATAVRALRSVALPGFLLAGTGAAIGVLASFGITPLMRHVIWGISTGDPGTFVGTAAILLGVAAVAVLLPTLRILRLNPADTLRNE